MDDSGGQAGAGSSERKLISGSCLAGSHSRRITYQSLEMTLSDIELVLSKYSKTLTSRMIALSYWQ